jgi:hypothetical protein
MSRQSASSRWTMLKVGVAVAGAAITFLSLLFGGGFIYNHWYNVPDLTYTVLPTYQLEGLSFAGLVVENRGRVTAHDVLINSGDLQTNIQQYSVDSEELWRQQAGGTTARNLVLRLDRMASGSALTVYLLTDDLAHLERLGVTAEEGPGHAAADRPPSQLSLLSILLVLLTALVIAALFYLALAIGSTDHTGSRTRPPPARARSVAIWQANSAGAQPSSATAECQTTPVRRTHNNARSKSNRAYVVRAPHRCHP